MLPAFLSFGSRLPLYEAGMSHKQVESGEAQAADHSSPVSSTFFFKRVTRASVDLWENPLRFPCLLEDFTQTGIEQKFWGEKSSVSGGDPMQWITNYLWRVVFCALGLNQIGPSCRIGGQVIIIQDGKTYHPQYWDTFPSHSSRFSIRIGVCKVCGCVSGVELNSSIMQDKPKPGRGGWGDQTWCCCLPGELPGLVKPWAQTTTVALL